MNAGTIYFIEDAVHDFNDIEVQGGDARFFVAPVGVYAWYIDRVRIIGGQVVFSHFDLPLFIDLLHVSDGDVQFLDLPNSIDIQSLILEGGVISFGALDEPLYFKNLVVNGSRVSFNTNWPVYIQNLVIDGPSVIDGNDAIYVNTSFVWYNGELSPYSLVLESTTTADSYCNFCTIGSFGSIRTETNFVLHPQSYIEGLNEGSLVVASQGVLSVYDDVSLVTNTTAAPIKMIPSFHDLLLKELLMSMVINFSLGFTLNILV
ncbi:hypothetical protein GEMRC1_008937 [Eukaryota sp. GEM-RC1]